MIAVGRWHLHFDGDLERVISHVCDLHRALGLSLPCDDERLDGDCDHVQIRLCTCHDYWPCAACAQETG